MGCDIHIVLEEKIDGEWVGLCASGTTSALRYSDKPGEEFHPWFKATNRDYRFFAALAGVRGDGPDPLGFPDDASQLARAQNKRWGGDAHSHSYCSLEEFCVANITSSDDDEKIAKAMRKKIKDGKINAVEALFYYVEDGKEYRVVFWFDN